VRKPIMRNVSPRFRGEGTVGPRTEITALKRADAPLQMASAWKRWTRWRGLRGDSALLGLVEKSPVPMWIEEAGSARILAVNDSALRLYGYGREQFLALTVAMLEARATTDSAALTHGRRYHSRADGTLMVVRLATSPVEIAGRPASLVAATDVTAEHDLEWPRLSERQYRQLFETVSDWYWEFDVAGCISFVSRRFESLYGMPVAELRGRRLNKVPNSTIDREAGMRVVAAIKARQPFCNLRHRLGLSDGRFIDLDTSGLPLFDERGTFHGYCGVSKDVTRAVAAENALRESEQRFRQLFEVSSDFYWETDVHGRISYRSPKNEAIFGTQPGEVMGKQLSEIAGVSIDPEMVKMRAAAVKARQPYRDFIYSRTFPDGKKHWFKVSAAPILGADGEFRGYRGVGAEITQSVEAEAAARLAQRRLDEALTYVTHPVVVFDAEDRVAAFNQAFTDLYGIPPAPSPVSQGVALRSLVEWQLQVGFYAEEETLDFETLLERHKSEGEHSHHLRDGRWMLVTYRRLPGGGRVGVWTDVTALKRAEAERRVLEAQLQHSQRLEAIGVLAGGAAHEINNALVPVIALTKLVAGQLPEDSRSRRNLATVLVGAERSRDLVKQILAFSRKEEQRHESVDLAAVLRDALRLMRATVPTSIRLEEDIASGPPVEGDPNLLHQVVVNLVTNAAQAIGESHGTITVGLCSEPLAAGLRLFVSDTGCGMDEAIKARIFEPFFTTKTVGKGTGLGLSVVHGIIKDHGGRIEVESTPGRGTRFDIVLPALAAEAGVVDGGIATRAVAQGPHSRDHLPVPVL
jgi:PAS domain S-box-containing protein